MKTVVADMSLICSRKQAAANFGQVFLCLPMNLCGAKRKLFLPPKAKPRARILQEHLTLPERARGRFLNYGLSNF